MTSKERNESATVQPHAADNAQRKRRDWWRPVALLAAILVVLVLARVLGVGERLGDLRDWIHELGPWGPFVFAVLYAAAVVAAVPGAPMTVAAGALFGSVLGVVVVINAATLGASLAFLIARYFARDAVARSLADNEKFQKLDRLTEQHGAIIVALTRLVPIIPFNLLNYGFGLTRVPFWTYVIWSWLCMLPATILFVVGADAFTKGLTQGQVPWALVAAFAGAALILTLLARHARRILKEKERKAKGE